MDLRYLEYILYMANQFVNQLYAAPNALHTKHFLEYNININQTAITGKPPSGPGRRPSY